MSTPAITAARPPNTIVVTAAPCVGRSSPNSSAIPTASTKVRTPSPSMPFLVTEKIPAVAFTQGNSAPITKPAAPPNTSTRTTVGQVIAPNRTTGRAGDTPGIDGATPGCDSATPKGSTSD